LSHASICRCPHLLKRSISFNAKFSALGGIGAKAMNVECSLKTDLLQLLLFNLDDDKILKTNNLSGISFSH
jgi:hypothetical protein